MLPAKLALCAFAVAALLGVNALLVLLDLSTLPLLLSSFAMVAAETLKVIFSVRRFHRAADGNVLKALMAAEGLSLLFDGVAIFVAVHLGASSSRVMPLVLCADFLALRIAGWGAISYLFGNRKSTQTDNIQD